MFFSLYLMTVCIGLFAPSTVALPHTFTHAVDDFTPLVPRWADIQQHLGPLLSKGASLYFPGSSQYENYTDRWSKFAKPTIAVVVEPANSQDVATTVTFANKVGLPFLAVSRGHGSSTTIGKLRNGIEIHLRALNKIVIAKDGKSATVEGGVYTAQLISTLYAHGKASTSGSCDCVGVLGAGLGGGLGRYEGYYGLVSDNIISAEVVLASGSIVNVSQHSHSDLYWGLRGAGHNFGIVTRATLKIHDYPVSHWYLSTFVFTQDKLEAVVTQVNKLMGNGTQPKEVLNNWDVRWNPAISTTEPIIELIIFYIGPKSDAEKYTAPFFDLKPHSAKDFTVPYPAIANTTGLGLNQFGCAHGYSRFQYPVGLLTYNVTATRQAYDFFKNTTIAHPEFNLSAIAFEGYGVLGTKAIPAASSAYPHREDNILVSILAAYAPDPSLDAPAAIFGKRLRDIVHAGQPGRRLNTYVNYVYGDETLEMIYGYEPWRLERLRGLKRKYDPHRRFNWFNPIV